MKTVSTIVPAFNAAAFLRRTIETALSQTYPAQEIVIVNDGSTDETGAIADALAARHPIVRVVHQANRGLPGARNRGIAEASGDYIAPLDADDLWHPEKLARQVEALERSPGAALAYGWFRRIDGAERVLPGSAAPVAQGWVFHRHLDQNFVSNGSSPLIRADVARAVGYDERYRSAEDYLFQLEIARHHRFVCVPAYLTGYRLTPDSMSRDVERMLRFHLAMFEQVRQGASDSARAIIDGRVAGLAVELTRNRLRRGDPAAAVDALRRAFSAAPRSAVRALGGEIATAVRRIRRPMFPAAGAPFASFAPEQPDGAWRSHLTPRRDAWLASLDAGGPAGFSAS